MGYVGGFFTNGALKHYNFRSMEISSNTFAIKELSRAGPIARGIALLRLLAAAGRRGVSLTALAQSTGLANSTVHRLLSQLMEQRLTMQLEGSRLYVIGPLAYELGLVAAQQFDIRQLCRPAMEQLSNLSSETVYLVQRSGNEAVCIDLHQGPSVVRVVTLQIGSRRPLGLGAGGLAILASLPEDEVENVIGHVMGTIEREWRFFETDFRLSLKQAKAQGYAIIENRITPGVTAIGRSFNDSLGQVFGAVTVAGLNARLAPRARDNLLNCLSVTAQSIEKVLRSHQWARHAMKT